jgi:hypothetical protein
MMDKTYASEQATKDLIELGKLPEPLRLAVGLERTLQFPLHGKAADCLRRLHDENEALMEALKDMCKGFHHLDDSDFPALARARDVLARAGEPK